MRSGRRAATVAVVTLALSGQLSQVAFASFVGRAEPASMSVSTATLAPPTGLAAANGCVLLLPAVELTWTASTSTFTAGYQVYRRLASETGFSLLGSVTGRTTTSYTDSTVVGGDSYVYVVHAVYESWSAPSAEASITVPSVCA